MTIYYKAVVNTDLIQNLRLIQALSESDKKVVIEDKDKHKFDFLPGNYILNSKINSAEIKLLNCNISHEKPSITIGKIDKNLIFSKKMFEQCKSLWSNEDRDGIYFSGLMTEKRKSALANWIRTHYKSSLAFNMKLVFFGLMQKLPFSLRLRFFKKINVNIGKLNLVDSVSGRTFPDKAFDSDYFSQMAKAKYVLCPNGDFVWTYRFFEAVMCGAIPIVEDTCELYDGFIFYHFSDSDSDLVWNKSIVDHNYSKCIEMLTLSESELDEALS